MTIRYKSCNITLSKQKHTEAKNTVFAPLCPAPKAIRQIIFCLLKYEVCTVIKIMFLFLFQSFLFFCFGSLTLHFTTKKITSLCMSMICGFLVFFAVFELIALPMILLKSPLSGLSVVWMVISLAAAAAAIFFCRHEWLLLFYGIRQKIKAHSFGILLLVTSMLLQIWIVGTHVDLGADASYYVAKVTTDVYHNSMGLYDPFTGNPLEYFNVRYLFSCFPEYNAVISQTFGVHPLIQAKTILPEIIIIITNMLYYQLGRLLFKGSRPKAALFVAIICAINLYSNTIYTVATFLLLRTYEGKAILANIILTGILYCFILLYKDERQLYPKIMLLAIGISSAAFSSSSMFIVPIAFAAGFFMFVIMKKNWRSAGWYLLYVLPNLATGAAYLLYQKGFLSFAI